MKIAEVSPIKPLTPERQRIKSMQTQLKRAQDAVKAEKARQAIKTNQQKLAKISATN